MGWLPDWDKALALDLGAAAFESEDGSRAVGIERVERGSFELWETREGKLLYWLRADKGEAGWEAADLQGSWGRELARAGLGAHERAARAMAAASAAVSGMRELWSMRAGELREALADPERALPLEEWDQMRARALREAWEPIRGGQTLRPG